MREFDALVIGAGFDERVAAALLARAGWRVCLLAPSPQAQRTPSVASGEGEFVFLPQDLADHLGLAGVGDPARAGLPAKPDFVFHIGPDRVLARPFTKPLAQFAASGLAPLAAERLEALSAEIRACRAVLFDHFLGAGGRFLEKSIAPAGPETARLWRLLTTPEAELLAAFGVTGEAAALFQAGRRLLPMPGMEAAPPGLPQDALSRFGGATPLLLDPVSALGPLETGGPARPYWWGFENLSLGVFPTLDQVVLEAGGEVLAAPPQGLSVRRVRRRKAVIASLEGADACAAPRLLARPGTLAGLEWLVEEGKGPSEGTAPAAAPPLQAPQPTPNKGPDWLCFSGTLAGKGPRLGQEPGAPPLLACGVAEGTPTIDATQATGIGAFSFSLAPRQSVGAASAGLGRLQLSGVFDKPSAGLQALDAGSLSRLVLAGLAPLLPEGARFDSDFSVSVETMSSAPLAASPPPAQRLYREGLLKPLAEGWTRALYSGFGGFRAAQDVLKEARAR